VKRIQLRSRISSGVGIPALAAEHRQNPLLGGAAVADFLFAKFRSHRGRVDDEEERIGPLRLRSGWPAGNTSLSEYPRIDQTPCPQLNRGREPLGRSRVLREYDTKDVANVPARFVAQLREEV